MFVVGMITFAQLATNYEANPTAFDEYVSHATDKLGYVAFAVFMYAAFKVSLSVSENDSGNDVTGL